MNQNGSGLCPCFDPAIALHAYDMSAVAAVASPHDADMSAGYVSHAVQIKPDPDRLEVEPVRQLNHGPIVGGCCGLRSVGHELWPPLVREGLREALVLASAVASHEVNRGGVDP